MKLDAADVFERLRTLEIGGNALLLHLHGRVHSTILDVIVRGWLLEVLIVSFGRSLEPVRRLGWTRRTRLRTEKYRGEKGREIWDRSRRRWQLRDRE